jgi:protein TonB
MTGAGFLEQKRSSPATFGVVVALHAGVIAAILMVKGPVWVRPVYRPLITTFVPAPRTPPPDPRPATHRETPRGTPIHTPPRQNDALAPNDNHATTTATADPGPVGLAEGSGHDAGDIPATPVHQPVFVQAQVDPRYRDSLQPPYPPAEQRMDREGSVRVRITIGPDGRVTAIERLSATSDAFWQATRRQAMSRWRFRPATEDGRAVAGTMTLTVTFRLTDA